MKTSARKTICKQKGPDQLEYLCLYFFYVLRGDIYKWYRLSNLIIQSNSWTFLYNISCIMFLYLANYVS